MDMNSEFYERMDYINQMQSLIYGLLRKEDENVEAFLRSVKLAVYSTIAKEDSKHKRKLLEMLALIFIPYLDQVEKLTIDTLNELNKALSEARRNTPQGTLK